MVSDDVLAVVDTMLDGMDQSQANRKVWELQSTFCFIFVLVRRCSIIPHPLPTQSHPTEELRLVFEELQ